MEVKYGFLLLSSLFQKRKRRLDVKPLAQNTLRPCVRFSRPFSVFAVDVFILVIRFSVYTED